MAAMLSTCIFSCGVTGLNYNRCKSNVSILPSSRLIPSSCTMRLWNLSSQHKTQQGKTSSQRITRSAKLQADGDESINREEKEQLSDVLLEDLIGMIKSADRKTRVLDQIRDLKIEGYHKFVIEETLPGKISKLELAIAEAKSKLPYQIKIRVDLYEDQLEKLGNDLGALKSIFSNIKNSNEQIVTPEIETFLKESLEELKSSLSDFDQHFSNIPTLKAECKNLQAKVENLQLSLDKTTKETDQDMHSCVRSFLESAMEFGAILDGLKEENKKSASDGPADDMNVEFWSSLLLTVDGWHLEKKISSIDAKLLRELVWKKQRKISDAFTTCKEKSENETVSKLVQLVSTSPYSRDSSLQLHIVNIAAEMAPIAKVGGLGDVVPALCKALQKKGHFVEIILPKYDCIKYDHIHNLKRLDVSMKSYFDGNQFHNSIWVGTVEGLPIYLIEPHHPHKFFERGNYYGQHDDFKRFSYFSRAALELVLQIGKKPDIIHCHDWQTAFVAPLYWNIYSQHVSASTRICFTCHNFEHQGVASASELASCGLDVQRVNRQDRMQHPSAKHKINALKGAIVYSNIVTTVSPTYAQEVKTSMGGHGLDPILNIHADKLFGILNGIDIDSWNPATDNFLEANYSDINLQGKTENKVSLRKRLGLSYGDDQQPLVGCVTRLVPQKGVKLIRYAIYRTLELGGQFVLLGSSPIGHIQREFEGIAEQFQNHDQIRLILRYDEALSHQIYAASDMFIIPSIFEPCGLTQMIAMRYGSVPIVRKTGGLKDSVFDIGDDEVPLQFRNGFTFTSPDEQELNIALSRAFSLYKYHKKAWQELVKKDMNINFSWDAAAAEYEQLYANVVHQAFVNA